MPHEETTGRARVFLPTGGAAATSAPGSPVWPIVIGALALLTYALASHGLMVYAADRPWAVAALFGPLLLVLAATGWKRRHAPTLAFCAAVLASLVAVVWYGGVQDANRMYVLQHGGIHLALAWAFGITLRPGSTALIEAMAERLHDDFTPAMRAYTHRLTGLWVAYFIAMVWISLLIYALAPWPWWSLYCNLLTPLAAIGFFVGEHAFRYWVHPEFERVSLRRALKAYRGHSQPTSQATAPRP